MIQIRQFVDVLRNLQRFFRQFAVQVQMKSNSQCRYVIGEIIACFQFRVRNQVLNGLLQILYVFMIHHSIGPFRSCRQRIALQFRPVSNKI